MWQVAWAHPKFGSILASCSYDRKVIIWKETAENQWIQVRNHRTRSQGMGGVTLSVLFHTEEKGFDLAL